MILRSYTEIVQKKCTSFGQVSDKDSNFMENGVTVSPGDALLLVDIQNDFLPGGSLGVKDGDKIVSSVNQLISLFERELRPIYASRDWHPEDHYSFKSNGGIWPIHCVKNSQGAEFASSLQLPYSTTIISKATLTHEEAYSAFQGTEFSRNLLENQVTRLFVCGLATDYCVLYTVRDALAQGFQVVVIEDAIQAVDVKCGDGDRAIQEMKLKGAEVVHSSQISPNFNCAFDQIQVQVKYQI
jgi:nicotinamidase/pyrazinamidase